MKNLIVSAFAAVALSTSAMATPLTDTFSGLYVLGDSLSDNGNLFAATGIPSAPYFDGRFSNGPVWNESLLQEFEDAGLPAVNGAFGGATTVGGDVPSLQAQTASLSALLTPFPGTAPLVAIWAGANDLRRGTAYPTEAANNVAASVTALAAAGVIDFLVFNLPDLGQTAELQGTAGAPLASLASGLFNTTLSGSLTGLGLNIMSVDIAALLNEAILDPAAFDLTNVTDACIASPAVCPTSLFFDGIHPTEVGHAIIEEEVRSVLAASLTVVPLPASAPMLLVAIGLLGWRARGTNQAA